MGRRRQLFESDRGIIEHSRPVAITAVLPTMMKPTEQLPISHRGRTPAFVGVAVVVLGPSMRGSTAGMLATVVSQANHTLLHSGEVAASGPIVRQVSVEIHRVEPATATHLVDNGGWDQGASGRLRVDH